ncbi:unnamed protein product [Protopolystoma xenopodis]|uniref:Uncharacterized protein n=1 Tax=Protopolystoma xenopodis TaxID=117903 RepID=A0A3S4ZU15_9PLAT|nr:unnamed protein product [Protopolystoma xenopodis]
MTIEPRVAARQANKPPPLYVCLDCADALNRREFDQLMDVLLPTKQIPHFCVVKVFQCAAKQYVSNRKIKIFEMLLISLICESKTCRSKSNTAVVSCWSSECAFLNGGRPIRFCQACHSLRHTNASDGNRGASIGPGIGGSDNDLVPAALGKPLISTNRKSWCGPVASTDNAEDVANVLGEVDPRRRMANLNITNSGFGGAREEVEDEMDEEDCDKEEEDLEHLQAEERGNEQEEHEGSDKNDEKDDVERLRSTRQHATVGELQSDGLRNEGPTLLIDFQTEANSGNAVRLQDHVFQNPVPPVWDCGIDLQPCFVEAVVSLTRETNPRWRQVLLLGGEDGTGLAGCGWASIPSGRSTGPSTSGISGPGGPMTSGNTGTTGGPTQSAGDLGLLGFTGGASGNSGPAISLVPGSSTMVTVGAGGMGNLSALGPVMCGLGAPVSASSNVPPMRVAVMPIGGASDGGLSGPGLGSGLPSTGGAMGLPTGSLLDTGLQGSSGPGTFGLARVGIGGASGGGSVGAISGPGGGALAEASGELRLMARYTDDDHKVLAIYGALLVGEKCRPRERVNIVRLSSFYCIAYCELYSCL